MPKKAAPKAETPKVEAVQETDARLIAGAEIADETALRNAREAAVKTERSKVKGDPQGDIDERMAALLDDHIAMGVRKG